MARKRGVQVAPPAQLEPAPEEVAGPGPVEAATLADLEAADRVGSALGQAALTMARRLDHPGMDTGSAMAAVAGRLEALLERALRGAGKASAPQLLRDQLAERRAARGA